MPGPPPQVPRGPIVPRRPRVRQARSRGGRAPSPVCRDHPVRDTLKGHSDVTQRSPPPEREGRGSRDDGTPAARAHVHPTGTPGAPRAASRAASVSMCATGSRRSCTTSSGSIAPTFAANDPLPQGTTTLVVHVADDGGRGRGNRHHDHQRHHDRGLQGGWKGPSPSRSRSAKDATSAWTVGRRWTFPPRCRARSRAPSSRRDRPRPNTGSTGTVHNHATSTTHPRLCVPRMPMCDWHVAFHDFAE